jgi:hypothetical protein
LHPAARDAAGASAQSAAAAAIARLVVRHALNEAFAVIAFSRRQRKGEFELTVCQKASAKQRNLSHKIL